MKARPTLPSAVLGAGLAAAQERTTGVLIARTLVEWTVASPRRAGTGLAAREAG